MILHSHHTMMYIPGLSEAYQPTQICPPALFTLLPCSPYTAETVQLRAWIIGKQY